MNNNSQVTKIDRYPGRWVFRQDQADIFRGRKRESEELFHLIRQSQVVVLFAKSGVGKSSLLNAGVSPLLLGEGFQPVNIFFTKTIDEDGTCPSDPLGILKKQIAKYKTGKEILTNADNPSLWEEFKTCHFDEGKIPVLIFDQFEELFGYPPEQVRTLLREFSELIHERPPSRVVQWLLEIDTDARTDQHMEWATQPNIKFVFAIRSDRLSEMQTVNEIIPAIFNNQYQLLPIQQNEAVKAITEPAKIDLPERFTSPPFSFAGTMVNEIVENLKDPVSGEIELSQLQIICNHIEEKVKSSVGSDNQITTIDKDVFNPAQEIDVVLQDNYETQLLTVGNEQEIAVCRLLMEDNLLENRTRVRLPKGTVIKFVTNEELIQKLLSTRLIKMETDIYGAVYYEISHDSLVDPILNAKHTREEIQRKENEHLKMLEERENLRQQRIAEAEQLRLDYYKLLEQNDLPAAIEALKKSLSIFDEYEILRGRVELRLLLAKAFVVSGRLDDSMHILKDTLHLSKEKKDLALEGKVYENYASFYEDRQDPQSGSYYEKALKLYRRISDFPQIGRLAEHMGGFNEQKYDQLIDKDDHAEQPEDVIMDSFNFYKEALNAYELIREIFGIKRVQRSIERVKKFAQNWGYLAELFTGVIHPLKGKGTIRVGRDVFNEDTNTYTIKNEIGFAGEFNFISRRHVAITPDLAIEDTQSLNGTTVNTTPLYYGNPRVLRDGDIIVLANMMPLKFTLSQPETFQLPEDCWGILITNMPNEVHYISGAQEIAVSLIETNVANIYETKVDIGQNKNAIIRFKLIDGKPNFFATENMAVRNSSGENIMTRWKIRTTMKNADRLYQDYILNTNKWLEALDTPLVPQLILDNDNEADKENILLFGSPFQLIFVPDYYKKNAIP